MRRFVPAFFLAVAVVCAASAARAQVRPKPPAGKPQPQAKPGPGQVKQLQNRVLIAELQQTHLILEAAKGNFGGHRVKALGQVNAAIVELKKDMKAGGKAGTGKSGLRPPINVSLAMVAKSGNNLLVIQRQLLGTQASPHRRKAHEHLQKAIRQVTLALYCSENHSG